MTDEPKELHEVQYFHGKPPIIVVQFFVIVCTVVGNGAVILAVVTSKTVRKVPNNIFISSLAIADFLIGAIVIPVDTVTDMYDWCVPEHNQTQLTKLLTYIRYILVAASTWQLAVISYDRYLFILHHAHYKSLMHRLKSILFFSGGWIMGIFQFSTIITPIVTLDLSAGVLQFLNFVAAFAMAIPMTIISICYFRILHFTNTRRRLRKLRVTGICSRTALTLSLLVGVFYIFVVPSIVYHLMMAITMNENCKTHTIVHSISYGNAPCNTFIYTIFNDNFRRAVLDIFRCQCRKSQSERGLTIKYDTPRLSKRVKMNRKTKVDHDQDKRKDSGVSNTQETVYASQSNVNQNTS